MDDKTKEELDRSRLKFRNSQKHNTKWIKLKDIAKELNLKEDFVFQKAKDFELDITSSVVSVDSTINEKVACEFVKFLKS